MRGDFFCPWFLDQLPMVEAFLLAISACLRIVLV